MAAISRKTLSYRTPPPPPTEREKELDAYARHVDPMRDRIVPIAMIVFGLLLNLRYFAMHYRMSLRDIGLLATVFASLAAAETIVMFVVAYAISDWLDVTFGRIGTALLKFAGIVTFCDGVFAGLPVGLIPGHGFFGIIAAFLLYEISCTYLFRIKFGDARLYVTVLGCFYTLLHALLVANLVNVTIFAGGARVSPFVNPKLWRLRPHIAMVVAAAESDLQSPDHAHSPGHAC